MVANSLSAFKRAKNVAVCSIQNTVTSSLNLAATNDAPVQSLVHPRRVARGRAEWQEFLPFPFLVFSGFRVPVPVVRIWRLPPVSGLDDGQTRTGSRVSRLLYCAVNLHDASTV